MSNNNGDMPAMPVSSEQGSDIDSAEGSPERYGMPTGLGLTKREHFAAMAMQGLTANADVMSVLSELQSKGKGQLNHLVARMAVEHADALLKALEDKS